MSVERPMSSSSQARRGRGALWSAKRKEPIVWIRTARQAMNVPIQSDMKAAEAGGVRRPARGSRLSLIAAGALGGLLLVGCGTTTSAGSATPNPVKTILASNSNPTINRHGSGQRYIFTGELITFLERGPAYTIFEDDANPGYQGPPAHVHVRQDEGFYILQGQVTFRGGKNLHDVIVAHPGDFVSIPRGTLHTWAVTGKTMAKVLTIFSPPGDFENLVYQTGHPTYSRTPPVPAPLGASTIRKIAKNGPKDYIVFEPPKKQSK